MQLSLKRRVAASFIIANAVVLVMGFTVFFFLDSLNNQISSITVNSNKISFWNTQLIAPTENIIQLPEGEYFKKLPNGYYIVIKKDIQLKNNRKLVTAIAMLPVFYEYYIETDYLIPEFSNKNKKSNIALSFEKTDYAFKSITGKELFYLKSKAAGDAQNLPTVTLILRVLAIFFLLGFIHKYSEWVSLKKGSLSGIGFLILSLLLVQFVIYFSPSILSLRQFELFDPSIYGYNVVLKSLGHLLINAAII